MKLTNAQWDAVEGFIPNLTKEISKTKEDPGFPQEKFWMEYFGL